MFSCTYLYFVVRYEYLKVSEYRIVVIWLKIFACRNLAVFCTVFVVGIIDFCAIFVIEIRDTPAPYSFHVLHLKVNEYLHALDSVLHHIMLDSDILDLSGDST